MKKIDNELLIRQLGPVIALGKRSNDVADIKA